MNKGNDGGHLAFPIVSYGCLTKGSTSQRKRRLRRCNKVMILSTNQRRYWCNILIQSEPHCWKRALLASIEAYKMSANINIVLKFIITIKVTLLGRQCF